MAQLPMIEVSQRKCGRGGGRTSPAAAGPSFRPRSSGSIGGGADRARVEIGRTLGRAAAHVEIDSGEHRTVAGLGTLDRGIWRSVYKAAAPAAGACAERASPGRRGG